MTKKKKSTIHKCTFHHVKTPILKLESFEKPQNFCLVTLYTFHNKTV